MSTINDDTTDGEQKTTSDGDASGPFEYRDADDANGDVENPQTGSSEGVEEQDTDRPRLGTVEPDNTEDTGWTSALGFGSERKDTADLVPVKAAYRNEPAVLADDGSVVGAIRIDPASMSMADDDDLAPHITYFAGVLTSLPPCRGMLVDTVDSLDYEAKRTKLALLEREYRQRDGRSAQMVADLANERRGVINAYEKSSTKRAHYLVLKVTKTDIARTLISADSALTNFPVVGDAIVKNKKRKLVNDGTIKRQMVATLRRRLNKAAANLNNLLGVNAEVISSTEYSRVIANSLQTETHHAYGTFDELVRTVKSPDPESHTAEESDGPPMAEPIAREDDDSEEERDDDLDPATVRDYKTLLRPRTYTPKFDGPVTLDKSRKSATIAVENYPEVPPPAFLEPVYKYNRPGVDVTVATHFKRRDDDTAQREQNQQEASLQSKLDSDWADFMDDYIEGKLNEAERYGKAISNSKYGTLNIGLTITVEADDRPADPEKPSGQSLLSSAVNDLVMRLEDSCNLTANPKEYAHDDGWKNSLPVADPEFEENYSMRADGLARQLPFQYSTLDEDDGIIMGLHDYLDVPISLNILGPQRENGFNGGVYGTIGSGKTTTLQEIANALLLDERANEVLREEAGASHPSGRIADMLEKAANSSKVKVILSTPLQDFYGFDEAYDGEVEIIGGETGTNPIDVQYIPPDKLEGYGGAMAPWKDMLNRAESFLKNLYDQKKFNNIGEKLGTWKDAIKEAHQRKENPIIPGEPETYKNKSATIADALPVLEEMVLEPENHVRDALDEDEGTLEDRADIARKILNHDIGPFEEDGEFHHFTKPSELDITEADVIVLDSQRYESDQSGGGIEMQEHLTDIYDQLKAFDGFGFLGVDEFHYMLDNPRAAKFFERTHLHSRHFKIGVWLATQEFGKLFTENTSDSGGEFKKTDAANSIFNNQPMQAYHFTKEMSEKWGDLLDLSKTAQEYIDTADKGEKHGYAQYLLVVDGTSYPVRLEMSNKMNPRQFALYQYDPTEDEQADDFWTYLENYPRLGADGVCEWGWT